MSKPNTSTPTFDLSAFTPDQLAALAAQLTSALPAPAPASTKATNGKAVTATVSGPFAGQSLSAMQAAIDANAKVLPQVKAELEGRVAKDGKSAKNAAAALARLAKGESLLAPKASAFAKDPAEMLADAQAKLADHRAKLVGEQAAADALAAHVATLAPSVAAHLRQPLEQAQRTVARRLEWIATQEANVVKHGGTVTPARKSTRTRRTNAA